jgi:hypothetical protein
MKMIIYANVRVPQHVNHLRFFVCELVHLMKFELFVYLTEKKLPFFSFFLLSLSLLAMETHKNQFLFEFFYLLYFAFCLQQQYFL